MEKEPDCTNELDSMCGVSDEELTHRFIEAVRIEKEICRVKGVSIACYDDKTNQVYLEHPDGSKEYV